MDAFVGAILLDKDSRIFLIKEEDKNQIGKNRWNLPGGSVDEGEGFVEATERETLKETGYRVKVKSVLGCYQGYKNGETWIYIVFETKTESLTKLPVEDLSIKDGRWFNKEELTRMHTSLLVHPDIKLVYKTAIAKKGLPLDNVRFVKWD